MGRIPPPKYLTLHANVRMFEKLSYSNWTNPVFHFLFIKDWDTISFFSVKNEVFKRGIPHIPPLKIPPEKIRLPENVCLLPNNKYYV